MAKTFLAAVIIVSLIFGFGFSAWLQNLYLAAEQHERFQRASSIDFFNALSYFTHNNYTLITGDPEVTDCFGLRVVSFPIVRVSSLRDFKTLTILFNETIIFVGSDRQLCQHYFWMLHDNVVYKYEYN
jgi:hypothetical protein